MLRRLSLVASLVFIMCSSGCGKPDECDLALNKAVKNLEQRLEGAESDGEKRAVTNVIESSKKHFPGLCRELDEEGKACLKRMDEFLEAGKKSDVLTKACLDKAREEELNDQDCLEAAEQRHAEELGDCLETMNKLEAELGARGQADYEAKQER